MEPLYSILGFVMVRGLKVFPPVGRVVQFFLYHILTPSSCIEVILGCTTFLYIPWIIELFTGFQLLCISTTSYILFYSTISSSSSNKSFQNSS